MIVEKGKETEETEQKEGRARDEGVCVCVGGGVLLLLVCLSGCH